MTIAILAEDVGATVVQRRDLTHGETISGSPGGWSQGKGRAEELSRQRREQV